MLTDTSPRRMMRICGCSVLHGRELESAGRLLWRSFTPEEYRPVDEQILRECRESGASGTYEMQYFRTDGTRVPVLIAAAFLSSAKDDGVAFVLDITERKRLNSNSEVLRKPRSNSAAPNRGGRSAANRREPGAFADWSKRVVRTLIE